MKHVLPLALATTFALSGLGVFHPVLAQAISPEARLRTNPGLIIPSPAEQRFQQEAKDKLKEIPPETPHVELPVAPPSTEGNVQLDAPSVHVKTLAVEGSSLFPETTWNDLKQTFEGRDISLNDLKQAVDAINQHYWSRGYLTTQAYIPPQDVSGGNIIIKVVEGRVGALDVKGNKYYRDKAILSGLDLEQDQVLNITDLQDGLNRSNQDNYYRLRAELTAGEALGETNVDIMAQEAQPWQITPTLDNQGRPFIGTTMYGLQIQNDSVFGFGDQLSTGYYGATGTNIALGSYSIPVNRNGDRLTASYGYSRVKLDQDILNQPDISGTSHNIGLAFSHAFDENRYWVGDVALEGRQVRSFFNDAMDMDARDNIRKLSAGITLNRPDDLGLTFGRLQLSGGFDVFGGNRKFWKSELFFTRYLNLPWNHMLLFRAYGQYTPDALPTAEAIQVGGAYSVRGFTEGLVVGDRGFSASIEDRWPLPFLSHLCPWLDQRLKGAAFFDIGQAWLDKSNINYALVGSNSRNTLLVGTGVGLRAQLSQVMEGFVDVGFSLVNRNNIEPNVNPTARIHFGVRSNLLSKKFRDVAETPPPVSDPRPIFLPETAKPQQSLKSPPPVAEASVEDFVRLSRQMPLPAALAHKNPSPRAGLISTLLETH